VYVLPEPLPLDDEPPELPAADVVAELLLADFDEPLLQLAATIMTAAAPAASHFLFPPMGMLNPSPILIGPQPIRQT
jgi:hypothetical protein